MPRKKWHILERNVFLMAEPCGEMPSPEEFMTMLAQLCCIEIELYKTCFIPRCRRSRRCAGVHLDNGNMTRRVPFSPPCLYLDEDRIAAARQLPLIMEDMKQRAEIIDQCPPTEIPQPVYRKRQ